MNELGERMTVFRAKNRLTQAEFARLAGLSTQTVHCVETGQQTPSRTTLAKIELVLNGTMGVATKNEEED